MENEFAKKITKDVAINLLSVVKRNNERFNIALLNSLNEVEETSDLYNFDYIRILKSKCEAELEEYVETGKNCHFTITKQEALHIAGIYESFKLADDKFTVQEINWFIKTIREFYFSN